jgi:hypothetical protein
MYLNASKADNTLTIDRMSAHACLKWGSIELVEHHKPKFKGPVAGTLNNAFFSSKLDYLSAQYDIILNNKNAVRGNFPTNPKTFIVRWL